MVVTPKRAAIVLALIAVVLQLVPLKRENPPDVKALVFDSPRTQELAARACMDCHSNRTAWPWYAYVAPVSFMVTHNVSEGRDKMNFSDLSITSPRSRDKLADEIAKVVKEGSMPDPMYVPLHPTARLTDQEKIELVSGLQKSLRAMQQ
jgi:hypothetical protein